MGNIQKPATTSEIADDLFGEGYLSEERRKKEVSFDTRYGFRFTSARDLSGTVFVQPPESWYDHEVHSHKSIAMLASATAEFIGNFAVWTHKRLNGFSGFDNIRFEIAGGVEK